jgi:hypothetical protein
MIGIYLFVLTPIVQQPLVKALLFPLGSAGWVALIENGMLPGFEVR